MLHSSSVAPRSVVDERRVHPPSLHVLEKFGYLDGLHRGFFGFDDVPLHQLEEMIVQRDNTKLPVGLENGRYLVGLALADRDGNSLLDRVGLRHGDREAPR